MNALLPLRVMVHIVAQCHEEGLEHYLRSYVKVRPFSVYCCVINSKLGPDRWLRMTFLHHYAVCTEARDLLVGGCEDGAWGAGQGHDGHLEAIHRLLDQQQAAQGAELLTLQFVCDDDDDDDDYYC